MTHEETLRLAVSLCRELALRGMTDDPEPGDLVFEATGFRRPVDPDAIGWLIGHGQAPWGADDPPGAPTRDVWDILPLNPNARLQNIGGGACQRWENATFWKVQSSVLERAGVLADLAIIEGRG